MGGPAWQPEAVRENWFVYIVRCADRSLYTGIAKDVAQRVVEHDDGRGARYTRGRGPVELVEQAGPMSHGDALRLELEVKRRPTDGKVRFLRRAMAERRVEP